MIPLKVVRFIEESRTVIDRDWGRGKWGVAIQCV